MIYLIKEINKLFFLMVKGFNSPSRPRIYHFDSCFSSALIASDTSSSAFLPSPSSSDNSLASSSGLISRSVVASRYSPEMIQKLTELNQKRAEQREGTVTIEEMGQAADETDAIDQDDRGGN